MNKVYDTQKLIFINFSIGILKLFNIVNIKILRKYLNVQHFEFRI